VDLGADGEHDWGIDGLSTAVDFPKAVIGSRIADSDVSALFEAVRDDATVLSVTEPVGEGVRRGGLDLCERHHARVAELIERVG
jgi:hypothetical protein